VEKKETELLEALLEKLKHLKTIKKRAEESKTIHYVELLLVLDHVVYEK